MAGEGARAAELFSARTTLAQNEDGLLKRKRGHPNVPYF